MNFKGPAILIVTASWQTCVLRARGTLGRTIHGDFCLLVSCIAGGLLRRWWGTGVEEKSNKRRLWQTAGLQDEVGRFPGGELEIFCQVAFCVVGLMRPAANIHIISAPKLWENLVQGGQGSCEGHAPWSLVHVMCRPKMQKGDSGRFDWVRISKTQCLRTLRGSKGSDSSFFIQEGDVKKRVSSWSNPKMVT